VIVKTDNANKHVILSGERFQVSMTWTQALALGSLLVAHSRQVEPPALPGKRYEPAIERDRR